VSSILFIRNVKYIKYIISYYILNVETERFTGIMYSNYLAEFYNIFQKD